MISTRFLLVVLLVVILAAVAIVRWASHQGTMPPIPRLGIPRSGSLGFWWLLWFWWSGLLEPTTNGPRGFKHGNK